jgi:hypothetical protein
MGCVSAPVHLRGPQEEEHYFKHLDITSDSISVTLDVPENTDVRLVFGDSSDRFSHMSDQVFSGSDKVIAAKGLHPCTLYYMQLLFHSGRSTRVTKTLEVRTAPPPDIRGKKFACPQR